MNTMNLEMTLPQPIYLALQSAGLNREKLRERATCGLAIQLYEEGHLSLGKAAEMADMPLLNFWLLLVECGISVFDYTEEAYEADVDTVCRLVTHQTEAK